MPAAGNEPAGPLILLGIIVNGFVVFAMKPSPHVNGKPAYMSLRLNEANSTPLKVGLKPLAE